MCRLIELRGKRTDTGKWVYGSLTVSKIGRQKTVIFEEVGYDESYGLNVDPETVGQYTGIKDKNGVKIFEGDILTFDDDEKFQVCYDDGAFWLKNDIGESFLMGNTILCINNNPNVIGNIHDNPELLEDKDEY